ncbi:hypothetical protein FIBSPDRAFT_1040035 [Athelia psychrophila]|uniref:Alpha-type protein kinase domain-containing protein n=1 Tax=Athelia psychrophila TaxID=1759441 RepID=A0A166R1G0_9AGAM|nr:hypothetical protein FIBSPDRAFT_1040035 [Fibularhizoctonia sp. CBS 109695]
MLTLFDPMSHTPNGKSGLGDHGRLGFEDFLDNHQCTPICLALELPTKQVMQQTLDDIIDGDTDEEKSDEEADPAEE